MVLISHRYKFIYFKNYKVASTSVESFFGQFCIDPILQASYTFPNECNESITEFGIIGTRITERNIQNKEIDRFNTYIKNKYNHNPTSPVWFNHKHAKDVKEDIGEEIFNQYYKFCIIRHPYDVILSAYFWEKSTDTVKEYCKRYCSSLSSNINCYFQNDNERLFLDDKLVCDFHIRYENLIEDMITVLTRLGITDYNIRDLPHFKMGYRSVKISYDNYYDEETKELIYQTYKRIFDTFGYKR
jgi:hypothetical protein